MAVRFILGRAGTGKTTRCLEELCAAVQADPQGPPLVLLVPEQATFQMEQALLGPGGLKGMMRAQVLSFQRLAWRVSLSAGGLARPPLSDLGKYMVLRALVEQRLDQLQVFGRVADRPGFIEKLARTISELRTYALGPAELQQHLAAMAQNGQDQTVLGTKLHDLALVMADLTAYTAGRFTDPDDTLALLAQRLPQSGLLKEAEVWVDGFSGFTPQELAVLASVFTCARQVHLTLCLDPAELTRLQGKHSPTDLFHLTLTTHDQLCSVAARQGVTLRPPLVLDEPVRFQNAPELAHLERHFFRPGQPRPWTGAAPALSLVTAQNRRQEVEAAAREVLRLIRDAGLRYREVAVVARNLDAYAPLVATVFAEHGIPAFVDQRRPVAHHPLVELLRAALETVIRDWSYAPVFRFLKTDLAPVSRAEADTLENYVLEHAIRGRHWTDPQPWTYLRRYTLEEDEEPGEGQVRLLERINAIRRRAVAELADFQRRLGGGRGRRPLTVAEITTALYKLLEDLQVAKRLQAWSTAAAQSGDLEAAREHEQVWDGVIELLDQMAEGLGAAEMSLPQYLQVLAAGLDGLRRGMIPPGLDQVVVGSAERSRHSGVRAALILGATDRDFPPAPPEDAIFTDTERERLGGAGLELGPTSRLRLFQEQYFTCMALTRGAERLWLSYPLAGDDGRVLAPAPAVHRLQQVFPAPAGATAAPPPPPSPGPNTEIAAIATPAQLAAALTRALRMHRAGYPLAPVWLDLYQWAATDPSLREQVAPTLAALRYEETLRDRTASLGPELATSLYGADLVTSVSRLEAFAACPFQHFAGYGLRLRERGQFRLEAPELGLFYHAAMSLFVRGLGQAGRDWDSLTPAEAGQMLDAIVDQLAPRLKGEILLSSPQHRYLLRVVRRTLQTSLSFLGEHIYQGKFRPLWVELPFGEAEDGLPPVTVRLPDGGSVALRGRIDRVDGARGSDGSWLLRVLDYKSSARSLDLGRFYHGLTLQLLLYLYAVVQNAPRLLGSPARPAGALYFPVHDPVQALSHPEPPERVAERRRKLFRSSGLVVADPEVVRLMDLQGLGLIPARVNKDGTLRKNAPAASPAQFQLLFRHLEQVTARLAQQVRDGEVAAAPYRLRQQVPCTFCAYRSVCQFDPQVVGQVYRSLSAFKTPAVLEQLAAAAGEEEGEDHE